MLTHSKKITILMFMVALSVGIVAYLLSSDIVNFAVFMIATYLALALAAVTLGKVQYKGKVLFNRK